MLSFFRRRWFHWDDPTPPLLSAGIKKQSAFFLSLGFYQHDQMGEVKKAPGRKDMKE